MSQALADSESEVSEFVESTVATGSESSAEGGVKVGVGSVETVSASVVSFSIISVGVGLV